MTHIRKIKIYIIAGTEIKDALKAALKIARAGKSPVEFIFNGRKLEILPWMNDVQAMDVYIFGGVVQGG